MKPLSASQYVKKLQYKITVYVGSALAFILLFFLGYHTACHILSKVVDYLPLLITGSISLRKSASFWVWSGSWQFINSISLTEPLKMKCYMIYEDWEFRQKTLRGLFKKKSWKNVNFLKALQTNVTTPIKALHCVFYDIFPLWGRNVIGINLQTF